ncbi:MAG: MotA/TolQ/ExbB proton channel family protein [Bacteroidaceae bacterium]|nr:MotA/TolQ/ExbB proton channel family protein [Bacteroidaceae bacterium]
MATTNATAPKGAPKKSQGFTGIKSGFAVIVVCWIIAEALYVFGAGHMSNFHAEGVTGFHFFQDQSYEPAGIVGTVYKGGFIVPLIWTQFIAVIALAIERAFAIGTANGKGNLGKFAANVKSALKTGDLAKAEDLCNKQQGSVANVVLAALTEYKKQLNTEAETEKKVLSIQKTVEEATALEMPMMQENLPIIGTIVTLGTLTGLLGTVMGMIKSFSAMAGEGGADSSALSVGISEALVNTASGIATGAAAVIAYNYFTNKIDRLTFAIDELGFTIVETFKTTQK